ncbi:MAG: hypothetical protein PW789_09330 [Edaphobacter sp.]|uniref:hypothetical protein n=1 Tax=Edaphobacter sp. TaxID=1934404 RepID=UPI0023A3E247|nr:hypothetical protein [Edaphobacter sp.]MDE1176796.1 hypothetical protein [Edaphobacter sp.]
MRKLIILLTIALIVVFMAMRQRIFVRDPLATLYRGDQKVSGVHVYINFSNDVLLEENASQRMTIVQNWNKVPGTPKALTCFSGMVCWTTNDHAEMVALGGASYQPKTEMSDREVSYDDGDGSSVRITLR